MEPTKDKVSQNPGDQIPARIQPESSALRDFLIIYGFGSSVSGAGVTPSVWTQRHATVSVDLYSTTLLVATIFGWRVLPDVW